MEDRRKFTRVLFSTPALLMTASGDYHCQLLDLSLKGALVTVPKGYVPLKDELASIKVCLPDSDIVISMEVEIRHVEHDHLGLHCTQIDLDSVTHLKRLIQLNVGDEHVLHRELTQLIHLPE
ncbi:PilZ domain-containing protein [Pseudoalteromonas byunsanensis]|uniref:Cyclic diguanosine monophosphate-binding protein n=1 Tax=Pseudoalteromonas byunsanensis TaxID=327939 RepID=A0A1S1NBT1_9GAMM|nr:PilZ domain-containing protein [Pseudoalteromonas byunsanensis]OHU96846.1 PilZ domain-containing protein [Pseudoalteromonas byunsanensis]